MERGVHDGELAMSDDPIGVFEDILKKLTSGNGKCRYVLRRPEGGCRGCEFVCKNVAKLESSTGASGFGCVRVGWDPVKVEPVACSKTDMLK